MRRSTPQAWARVSTERTRTSSEELVTRPTIGEAEAVALPAMEATGRQQAVLEALARCAAEVLHLPAERRAGAGRGAAVASLGEWLGGRNLGAVPVREPAAFSWAGPWIGLYADDGDPPWRPVVRFGAPSATLLDPLADAYGAATGALVDGLVVAALDTRAAWRAAAAPGTGVVEALAVAPASGVACVRVARVEAAPGGLAGDRYALGVGAFSAPGRTGQDLTLIEAEAVEALSEALGEPFAPEQARRNVIVRGVDLDALIGRRFRLGDVECVGRRRGRARADLQRLTRPGVLRGLVHRGGLRADVLGRGTIAVGDPVEPLP